jgi:hypothetical protein
VTSADFGNDYKDDTVIVRNDSIASAALSENVTFYNSMTNIPFFSKYYCKV